MSVINIAIDGPAGAGKSSIAKSCAKELGIVYVDTGALYRAIALYVIQNKKDTKNIYDVESLLNEITVNLKFEDGQQKVFLGNKDVSDEIRTPEVSMGASDVSSIPAVRDFLFALQCKIARENNVIMDGRDIGTVVLPNADLKIFLTASAEERAKRRFLELKDKPDCPPYEEILADIKKRDFNDTNRKISPLKQADDAVLLDTSDMDFKHVRAEIISMINRIR